MYIYNAILVHREKDNFENGCDPDTSLTQFFGSDYEELTFQDETLKGLVNQICEYFNVKVDSVLLDSCEELGRLDVQTYTKFSSGLKCAYNRLEVGFKNGEYDLYLNNIVGSVTLKVDVLNLTELYKRES